MPQISVVIPTINRALLLPQAVHSVMAQQEYDDFDLWIIDDGSTDHTSQVVGELQATYRQVRPYIGFYYYRQLQQGVSVARNTGIRLSAGRFLAFLDSDDRWMPTKLARQREFFQQNPEVAIAQTDELWIRNGKRVNPHLKHRKSGGQLFVRSLELCLISPSAVMITRELLSRFGGFDPQMIVCEDYDLWLKITSHYYQVGFLNMPLVMKYGGHNDQLSRQYPVMDYYRIKSMYKIWQEHLHTPRLQALDAAALVQILEKKCRIVLAGMKKHNNFKNHQELCDIYQSIIR